MARTDNLKVFLTDIAESIREKKGTSDTIKASDFDTEIASISGGGGQTRGYTGSFDKEGLKQLGYDDETIEYYNQFVWWNEEDNKKYKIPQYEIDYSKNMEFTGSTSDKIVKYFNNYDISGMATISIANADNLIIIPKLNTSHITSFTGAFSNNYSLMAVPKFDTSNATSLSNMFSGDRVLIGLPDFDTSKVTNLYNFVYSCMALKIFPKIDTSKVTTMQAMCNGCYSLREIPELNASSLRNVRYIFSGCKCLIYFGGFKDYGKAFTTNKSENYTDYALSFSDCTSLTHGSLINILNGLYDIKSKGCNPQKISLGSTNYAKLTEEEIAIGINKGWNIVK